jgi:TIR domain/Pentapeptide repeats (8 copies)
MANPEHVEIVKQGAKAIAEWREKNPDTFLNLRGADLSRTNLSGAELSGRDLGSGLTSKQYAKAYQFHEEFVTTDLRQADLKDAVLRRTRLVSADLTGAHLERADLRDAVLHGASLMDATLDASDLRGAELNGAILDGASFVGTIFGLVKLCDVDLSKVHALETAKHHFPSHVDVMTLRNSKGSIPDEFLRNCGFMAWESLEAKLFDPALTPEQFADLQYKVFQERNRGPLCIGGVFISYSRDDAKFVDKVYERLRKEGIPAWLDRHDMVAGPLQTQVSRAIRLNDVVLLVLSKASIKSGWVENELDMARRKEKDENRDALCPVALDESWKAKVFSDDNPRRELWITLAQKNILDFSGWKTKSFDEQFGKLLRGMKIYYEPKKA